MARRVQNRKKIFRAQKLLEQGKSRKEVAKFCKVSATTISNWKKSGKLAAPTEPTKKTYSKKSVSRKKAVQAAPSEHSIADLVLALSDTLRTWAQAKGSTVQSGWVEVAPGEAEQFRLFRKG